MGKINGKSYLQEARWKAGLAAQLYVAGDVEFGGHALRDAWYALLDLRPADSAEEAQLTAIRAVLDDLALGRPLLAA